MESYKIKVLAGMTIFLSGVMIFPVLVWLHPYIVPALDPWTSPVKIEMKDMKQTSYTGNDPVDSPKFGKVVRDQNKHPISYKSDEDGFAVVKPRWDSNLPISNKCKKTDSAVQCMACAIYFEARGENHDIQNMVGQVILNRVRSRDYPNSICKVVWQRKQFSWTHDLLSDKMRNTKAKKQVISVAREVLRQADYGSIPKNIKLPPNACWYHDDSLSATYWSKKMTLVKKYGPFYIYKGKACRSAKPKPKNPLSVKMDQTNYVFLAPAHSPRF